MSETFRRKQEVVVITVYNHEYLFGLVLPNFFHWFVFCRKHKPTTVQFSKEVSCVLVFKTHHNIDVFEFLQEI